MACEHVSHQNDSDQSAIANGEKQTGGIRGFVSSLFAAPFVHERELRHIVVPCGNTDFDVYLLGTNHRALASRQDVTNVLELVKPDIIFVELCRDREEILDSDLYEDSEYYSAAQYRCQQMEKFPSMPTSMLILGDRPYRTGDLRWWESIESTTGRIATFLLWPFLLPFRARFMGHTFYIEERDTFMAYTLHKGCVYYVEQNTKGQARSEQSETKVAAVTAERKTLCSKFFSHTSSTRSSPVNAYFTDACSVTRDDISVDKPTRNPSLVAIIGASHLDGICSLLENERDWPIEMMLEVCESERHPRDSKRTQDLARDVEEYRPHDRKR